MKRQILFVQGGGLGAHNEDGKLVESLRNRLDATYEVRYPRMPRENDPDYQRWRAQIRKELAAVKGKVILVGHSLGGSFLLKYLCEQKIETEVAGLFLIATPYWGGEGWRYDGYDAVALPRDF
ncbi:MAG: alpha/beta fold hydrolase, partial [Verrucomicrobia bacterium]|nr:alpha/beta fold hydrolase [Verrucomicrobiota bacterium]